MRPIVTILLFLISCNKYPVKVYGNLKLDDPELEYLVIVAKDGKVRQLSPGPLHIEILSSKKIVIRQEGEKQGLTMELKKKLSSFIKKGHIRLQADKIGQKYDLEIRKQHKFQNTQKSYRRIACWYPTKKWVTTKEGVPMEVEQMKKGHQDAHVEIKDFEERIYFEFYYDNFMRKVATITGRPRKVKKLKVLKRVEGCGAQSLSGLQ